MDTLCPKGPGSVHESIPCIFVEYTKAKHYERQMAIDSYFDNLQNMTL